MRKFLGPVLGGLLCAICFVPAWACLWDRDTLLMERQRFPDAFELITGKFLRHSKPYYEWRVSDRLKKLSLDPNRLEYYDDLAVAYDKLGKHELAIQTILKKDRLRPGLYETIANLGTFKIHSGDLAEGLKDIERAIEINTDAHFGREGYQKLLVEYVIEHRVDGKLTLPIVPISANGSRPPDFVEYVMRGKPHEEREAEIARAVKGVLGMMRFGNHASPVLLEALGNILLASGIEDAKQLAARAYLKASYEVKDPSVRDAYVELASQALLLQKGSMREQALRLPALQAQLDAECEAARTWYARIEADELTWSQEGGDLDAWFEAKYLVPVTAKEMTTSLGGIPWGLMVSGAVIAFLAYAAFWFKVSRSRRAKPRKKLRKKTLLRRAT